MSDDEIVKDLLVESYENLDRLDRDLVGLEKNPQDREAHSRHQGHVRLPGVQQAGKGSARQGLTNSSRDSGTLAAASRAQD